MAVDGARFEVLQVDVLLPLVIEVALDVQNDRWGSREIFTENVGKEVLCEMKVSLNLFLLCNDTHADRDS